MLSSVFFRLHLPIIIFLLLIVGIFLVEGDKTTGINLNLLIFEIELPVKSATIARTIMVFGAVASLANLLLLDFAQFFKPILEMEVHFDPEGIRQRLAIFSQSELDALGVITDYEKYQIEYYEILDRDLNSRIREAGAVFMGERKNVDGKGWTIFYVTKIGHIHKYHITKAQGHLVNTVQRFGKPDLKFKSIFEQLASSDDYIRPSLFDLVFKRYILILPRFRQTLVDMETSMYTEFHHTIIAVTKIYSFPLPSYSDTLYLFEMDNIGKIPIGYCIYS